MSPKLFLSYRRDDTGLVIGRIHDHLVANYGDDSVFFDIDKIPVGVDFRDHIAAAVRECKVLLAVIGKQWVGPHAGGARRLDSPSDFVRLELEAALAANVAIVPVLVGGADMPAVDLLPPSLRELAFRNAAHLDTGRDFKHHMNRLLDGLSRYMGPPQAGAARGGAATLRRKLADALSQLDAMESDWDRRGKDFEPLNRRTIALLADAYPDIADTITKGQHDLASVNDMVPYFRGGVQEALDRLDMEATG